MSKINQIRLFRDFNHNERLDIYHDYWPTERLHITNWFPGWLGLQPGKVPEVSQPGSGYFTSCRRVKRLHIKRIERFDVR